MLQKSSREERLGCLFCLVGSLLGLVFGVRSFAAHAEAIRSADPHATVCGLPVVAAMFWGTFLGGVLGALSGMTLSHLLPPSKPHA